MSNTKKVVVALIVLAILLIGVAYAAITNVTLNITGSAKAELGQDSFKVEFSGKPSVSSESNVVASITDEKNATMNVTGLTAKGDKATATYTVQNTSNVLTANLSATVTNSNSEYFDVSYEFEKETLTHGEPTKITVTVELMKTPITESVSSTIGVQITAEPAEPAN